MNRGGALYVYRLLFRNKKYFYECSNCNNYYFNILAKLVPLAYGIHKLQISCVVEDEKVSIDWLQETLQEIEDFVSILVILDNLNILIQYFNNIFLLLGSKC